jgi:hypothetical protein
MGLALGCLVGALALTPGIAVADELPEDYRYEMVSPLDTGGQRAIVIQSSVDGDRLLIASPGGFPGTENLPKLGSYALATRTATGWTATPVDPPASQYPFLSIESMIDYSEDLTRSLWFVNKLEDKGTNRYTMVVREADGSIVQASPTLDDGFGAWVAGSSADLSTFVIWSTVRPALTDGTVDARSTIRKSLAVVRRQPDGTFELQQVAYRAGATMFPTCAIQLGGTNAATSRNAVSADGSKIFFTPTGIGVCGQAANARVWVKDGDADPIDISATQCTTDCGIARAAIYEGASRDGSRAFFGTEEKLVDGDQDTSAMRDLYEYDFDANGSKLIPITASTSAGGAGVLRVTRVSPDGSHVYFVANGRPLAGENARGATPQPGGSNFYVYHREQGEPTGTITFIGALDPVADSNQWTADVQRNAQTSASGRFLLFTSAADLASERLPGDIYKDLYRYDAQTDDLQRIWSNEPAHNGAARTGEAFLEKGFGSNADGARWRNSTLVRQISEDGSKIGFETEEPLSPDDTNGESDAYLWQVETDRITLLSDGKSLGPSRFQMMTPSGESIYFSTASPLVDTHTSGAVAAYVARKGGGFPDISRPPVVPCEGDACQGPEAAAPDVFASPPSATLLGGDNLTPSRPPAIGNVRVAKVGTVRGASTRIRVRAPGKGRIALSGAGISRASKAVGKAATYRVPVKLSKRGRATLARDGRLKVQVFVRFVSARGMRSQARVSVTFKAKRAARSVRRATVLSSDSRKGR